MKDEIISKHTYYNNKFFAKWARLYDYEKYLLFSLRKRGVQVFNIKPPKKVLDVATGTGAQAYELARLGYDTIGIDLSPEMLEQAKKKISSQLKLKFQQADGTNMPFKDNSFDASTISLGLHDMPYEIGILVLKEMKRVTKNNGDILIIDYMEPKKHWISKFSYQFIKRYETPMYKPFIEKGIDAYLKEAKLAIYKKMDFLGLIQILLIKNRK